MPLYFHPFFTNICISSSFSQSALVRFSRGMLQKFFQISLLRESISAASASVTVPLAVLYILCSFLRTSFINADVFKRLSKTILLCTICQEVKLEFFKCAESRYFFRDVTLLTA